MSFESVDIYVRDTTPATLPVAGVVIKVLSQDSKLVFSVATTDAQGHAGFLLPSNPPSGTTYQLRAYKFGVALPNPQLFVVLPSPLAPGQTNAFNVAATLVTPPVPNDARLCTAFGFFRDITGAPQQGVQIHIVGKFDPVWVEGAAVVKERVTVTTDATGYAQVNLFRNAQYNCTVQGEEDITRHINVPDAPNVNLPDLIFPVVSSIVTTPVGPYVVRVGQQLTLNVSVFGSDGENLGTGIGDVLYSLSDPTLVNLGFTATTIVVTGITPGITQLQLKRADQSIIRIPDAGVQGQPIPITVTP